MEARVEDLERIARPILQTRGIEKAGIFGSRARGDHRADSDVDIVIECPEQYSLYDLVGLQLELSEKLGVAAHVSTYRSLHPRMQEAILSEERPLL